MIQQTPLERATFIDINSRLGMSLSDNEYVTDIMAIERSIYNILSTPIGSRFMRPTFGSRLLELLYESQTPDTAAIIKISCIQALKRWEPRIEAQLARSSITEIPGGYNVVIGYRVLDSNVLTSSSLNVTR